MKRNRRIGINGNYINSLEFKSIEYIRGYLHNYADLNTPNSTLSYDYGIIEFAKSDNNIESLKNLVDEFKNQPIKLKLVEELEFKNSIGKWFFENGELSEVKFNDKRKENEIERFYALLNNFLEIKSYFRIENLKSEFETVHLDLGVFYEYFLLIGDKKNCLLYFRYDD